MRIAVDASGGEYAPKEIVKGAIKAASDYKVGIDLIGNRSALHVLAGKHLKKHDIRIIPATDVISCNENPVEAIKSKPHSAIVIGTQMVKRGLSDAFVSAGSTGAVLCASIFCIGMIKGIDRPAVCSIFKLSPDMPALLLDAGANADCRPSHLSNFATLGDIYARSVLMMENPKIGLLSNGEEEAKGNRLVKESHQLIKKLPLNFIGNIEGHDIFKGTSNVIVTDGFTGNIILKTIEGMGEAIKKIRSNIAESSKGSSHLRGQHLLADVGLGFLTKGMDYREYGGACLLGIDGVVIISHGRSQAKAIKNAIGLAKRTVEQNVCQRIKEAHINEPKEQ